MAVTFKGITFNSVSEVESAVSAGKISMSEGFAVVQELSASAKDKEITFKISPKGGLSVYGLGQFPVTLYAKQWVRLGGKMADILAYIETHKGQLSTGKGDNRFLESAAKAQAEYNAKKQAGETKKAIASGNDAPANVPHYIYYPNQGFAIGAFETFSQAVRYAKNIPAGWKLVNCNDDNYHAVCDCAVSLTDDETLKPLFAAMVATV